MRALRWLARHWYIPLLALLAAMGIIARLFGDDTIQPGMVARELEAIDATEKKALSAIALGEKAANAEADYAYKETIANMATAERRKSDSLRGDPVRRVRFLNRLSARKGTD